MKKLLLIIAIVFAGFALKQIYLANLTDDVSLYGENNNAVDLFDLNDPRIRIVYFGFTRCPDVCPTSLAMLSGAFHQIDDTTLSQFRPIFITLDPQRDSPEHSAEYAHYFHKKIEGSSGSLQAVNMLTERYGVTFHKTELKDSALEYTIDHSSYFYFLTPDGTLITKVPHTVTPEPIVKAIMSLSQ
ncbi:SCO family protein [Aliivibrio finisterrensis]|uniref:SCO family protein n=1 Tax=Aliivibrio finisterrensis TaxID=511998 RepID=UPI00102121B2|nr:SCO family protein [Aliivibrio finisterrensis]RYU70513.1 SCO family protein [Aliivibrio finisterrensis]RYU74374.1 SCO family protein [Aliivibrio finisterrensis]RYU76980.1 SCO family protein [Aliivibrio finisterrensis]